MIKPEGETADLNMLHRARYLLRTEGARSLRRRALGKYVYARVVLLKLNLSGWERSIAATVPIEVAELRPADISAYLHACPYPDPGEIDRRMAIGHRCFLTWTFGRVSSAVWYASGRVFIPEVAAWLELEAGQVYGYDSWTAPELRGCNIAGARASRTLAMLRDEGFSSAAAYVLARNSSGLRAVAKLGYRPVAIAASLRLGVVRLDFSRSADRQRTWWVGRARQPSLRI